MPKKISRYRRRFGQVFLRDPLVVEQIVQSARLDAHETILEIGPGRGALTFALAKYAMTLYAIEIEAHYVQELHQRFATVSHVHIIEADASTYDYAQLPAPLVVMANLPYSTGVHILRHLFTFRQRLSRLIVMLQKEVAARLLAPPGSSAYGGLSVFFQYYAAMRPCFDVSSHAFTPRPAVDSTVLILEPFTPLPWPSRDEAFLFWLVKCAFAHRRKTLRKNLSAVPHLQAHRAATAEILATLHLDGNTRAQELHVSQFVQLAESLGRLLPHQQAPRRVEP
jgi:16S rRNA (adenine1518-N6/adenine1519-N6)-dimethyltransferase